MKRITRAHDYTPTGGSPTGGDYTTSSEDADDRVSTWDQYWQYQGMTVLFATEMREMTEFHLQALQRM